MRVIAGRSRGRILHAPSGGSVRPTSDRVREAIFDILGSLTELDGLFVADLFAGSGAMGIEALSRGAGFVVFVDRDPAAITSVRANLAATGLEQAPSALVRADVVAWLSGARTGSRRAARPGARPAAGSGADSRAPAPTGEHPEPTPMPLDSRGSSGWRRARSPTEDEFGAGPPPDGFDVALVDPPYRFDRWGALLGLLDARIAVLESDRPVEVPERFTVAKNRRYGGTLVTVVRATGT